MDDPVIVKLLNLQERDANCDRIKDQLRRIPLEVNDFEKRIASEENAIEQSREAINELEVRRRDLESEVGVTEEQANRYKNQQLLVKKNEEYAALAHEISALGERIGDLEDKVLELMLEIDESRESSEKTDASRMNDIADYQRHIKMREAHRSEFESELSDAESAVNEAAMEVEESVRKIYEYVKGIARRAPYVVPIDDHKCTGCHLRVSIDVEVSAKTSGVLARCSHCGRIVYY